MKIRRNISIDPALWLKVGKKADRKHMSISAIITMLLNKWLEKK